MNFEGLQFISNYNNFQLYGTTKYNKSYFLDIRCYLKKKKPNYKKLKPSVGYPTSTRD